MIFKEKFSKDLRSYKEKKELIHKAKMKHMHKMNWILNHDMILKQRKEQREKAKYTIPDGQLLITLFLNKK